MARSFRQGAANTRLITGAQHTSTTCKYPGQNNAYGKDTFTLPRQFLMSINIDGSYTSRGTAMSTPTPTITRPPLPAAPSTSSRARTGTASTRSPPSPSASFADPWVVRELHSCGMPVRLRDGVGLVGPLVVPGVTSCLGCHKE